MDPKLKMEIEGKMMAARPVPPGKAGPFTYPGLNDLRDYATRMYEWGRAVRRDILVLEYHLKKAGVSPTDFYGDPGDPPPIVE